MAMKEDAAWPGGRERSVKSKNEIHLAVRGHPICNAMMRSIELCCRVNLLAVPIVAIHLSIGLMPARSQDFEAGKISICANKVKFRTDACKDIALPLNSLDRRVFRNKRVDFKFSIFGKGAALTYLQNKNYLPVRVGVWRDGIKKDDDIALDIGQADWDENEEELSRQFSDDGQFKWRTFFHINMHNARTISIEINNAQGQTMLGDGKPARLSLEFIN